MELKKFVSVATISNFLKIAYINVFSLNKKTLIYFVSGILNFNMSIRIEDCYKHKKHRLYDTNLFSQILKIFKSKKSINTHKFDIIFLKSI